MGFDPGGEGRINLFSLVAYLPDPLASFVDGLRQELVPSCNLRAHVTILPPRPLSVGVEAGAAQVRAGMRDLSPFEVQVRDVGMFAISSVVFLGLGGGFSKLCEIHDMLSVDGLLFKEPYPYHPHVTVAQQITPEQIPGVFELARRRWAQYPHRRSFLVDSVTFVQGTRTGAWIDLDDCPIRAVAAIP
jgi:2'-5' RNA ligase